MKRSNMIGILILALAVAIVVLQNTESVQTKILFFTFTMPRAILLFLTCLMGFIIDVLSSLLVSRKKTEISPR
jgi:uncharacterized integral membrane protein